MYNQLKHQAIIFFYSWSKLIIVTFLFKENNRFIYLIKLYKLTKYSELWPKYYGSICKWRNFKRF